MRRVLSVWCPDWAIERLPPRSLPPRSLPIKAGRPPEPVVAAATLHGIRIVAAACPRARAKGVVPGQKLADARAVCPEMVVHDADPAGDAAALRRLAAWCERYTPLAVADDPDGLWLDITGCAHLWGGEQALVDDLSARLAHGGHRSHVAVAATPGLAWARARTPGLPHGADIPLAALRLDAATVAALRRLGVRTAGDLARLPRGEVSRRFGPDPVRRLDQLTGRAAEAIAWPRPVVPCEERLAFAEPILTPEDLARALLLLADRLCDRFRADGRGGRRFTAEFFRTDGERPAVTVATALPTREPAYLHKLLAARLDTVDPGFGVEVVRLSAGEVAELGTTQPGLAGEAGAARLPAVLDQVINRVSPARVWRSAPQGSHVPERAAIRVPPLSEPPLSEPPLADGGAPLERPLRLMTRPEPIVATALTPDHPPARFVWRGVHHRVRAATGPERIAHEWWRARPIPDAPAPDAPTPDAPATRPDTDRIRDYYQLEDMDGARFWVFRAGLSPGRWFLHGIFG